MATSNVATVTAGLTASDKSLARDAALAANAPSYDSALLGATRLLQQLRAAGHDVGKAPVTALVDPFSVGTTVKILDPSEAHIRSPKDFDCMRSDDPNFDDYCSASRTVGDAIAHDDELAEAIVQLMNRAYALGAGTLGDDFHVTPRKSA